MCKRWIVLIVLIALLTFGGASAELVGHWAFDEGQGTTAYDSSGNGHHGTLQGDPQWVVGKINGALEFDGDGDYVEVPDHESLHLWERFTLAAWIYQLESRSSRIIDKIGAGTSNGPHLDTHPGTTLRSCSGDCVSSNADYTLQEWHHVAVTFDDGDMKLYIDGALAGEGSVPSPLAGNTLPLRIGAASDGGSLFHGLIDDAAVFSHALTNTEIQAAMAGIGSAELAANPNPKDGAFDVPRDVVLSWETGEFAVAHDVYLGTVFDDVNDANRANPLGALVSQRQAVATYDPAGVLDFETTYYWRVDEVNAPPTDTIFKGEVWSFTTEPVGYPIANVIATSNGTSEAAAGPQNTVNGSGLDAADQHSTVSSDMWLAMPGAEPLYIQYEFDRVYKLHQMLVWNYNVQFELLLGFGIKAVTVEYSENGTEWTSLGDVELARASAKATYEANTTVEFGGVPVKYVRLNVNSGFGMMGQYGLSEVRFLYIPAQAREPKPGDGVTDVEVGTALAWRSGREAVSHEVYLSTDPNALTLAGTVDSASFVPALEFGSTYYWQIVEVNEADVVTAWAGDIWRFSTQEYALIDGFETYNDDIEARTTIFDTWLDGWVNDTGSTVGYFDAPFAERKIVRSGAQSMPLQYDNTASPYYSEAERTFETAQDWMVNGADSLVLYIQGVAPASADGAGGGNAPAPLYVAIEDGAGKVAVATNPDTAITTTAEWQEWRIPFSGLAGVNMSRVEKMSIGIGNHVNPTAGGTGIVYIDDIGYGRPAAE